MNKYTCSKCGQVSIVPSREEKIEGAHCTCGTEPVTLIKGVVEVKNPKPKNVVAPTMAKSARVAFKPNPPVVYNPSETEGTIVRSAPLEIAVTSDRSNVETTEPAFANSPSNLPINTDGVNPTLSHVVPATSTPATKQGSTMANVDLATPASRQAAPATKSGSTLTGSALVASMEKSALPTLPPPEKNNPPSKK